MLWVIGILAALEFVKTVLDHSRSDLVSSSPDCIITLFSEWSIGYLYLSLDLCDVIFLATYVLILQCNMWKENILPVATDMLLVALLTETCNVVKLFQQSLKKVGLSSTLRNRCQLEKRDLLPRHISSKTASSELGHCEWGIARWSLFRRSQTILVIFKISKNCI